LGRRFIAIHLKQFMVANEEAVKVQSRVDRHHLARHTNAPVIGVIVKFITVTAAGLEHLGSRSK